MESDYRLQSHHRLRLLTESCLITVPERLNVTWFVTDVVLGATFGLNVGQIDLFVDNLDLRRQNTNCHNRW